VSSGSRRFVRVPEELYGHKAFSRDEVTDRLPLEKRPQNIYSAGEFLGRLWSVYGPTKEADKGFKAYTIVDTQTDRMFAAYSGSSGPAYRADEPHDEALLVVLEDFEADLAEAPLVDCAVQYNTDEGRVSSGVRNGVPFDE
jgi:hypothetical protein